MMLAICFLLLFILIWSSEPPQHQIVDRKLLSVFILLSVVCIMCHVHLFILFVQCFYFICFIVGVAFKSYSIRIVFMLLYVIFLTLGFRTLLFSNLSLYLDLFLSYILLIKKLKSLCGVLKCCPLDTLPRGWKYAVGWCFYSVERIAQTLKCIRWPGLCGEAETRRAKSISV